MTDNASYYVLKIPSIRCLSGIQNSGACAVPQYLEGELNLAMASSSFVVLIYSVVGSYSFDGYALCSGAVGHTPGVAVNYHEYPTNSRLVAAPIQFVRRGVVPFSQVSHIRDDQGLQGRSVSSAKEGMRLGLSAARALCRAIDKRAYRDDPIHYKDSVYQQRVLHASGFPTCLLPPRPETDFICMSYSEYVDWFNGKGPNALVPSASQTLGYK